MSTARSYAGLRRVGSWPTRLYWSGDLGQGELAPDAWYVVARVSHRGLEWTYRCVTIPIPFWKDVKFASSPHHINNPLQPAIGWYLPRLAFSGDRPISPGFHWSWRCVRGWVGW